MCASIVNRYASKGGGVLFLKAHLKTMFLCGGMKQTFQSHSGALCFLRGSGPPSWRSGPAIMSSGPTFMTVCFCFLLPGKSKTHHHHRQHLHQHPVKYGIEWFLNFLPKYSKTMPICKSQLETTVPWNWVRKWALAVWNHLIKASFRFLAFLLSFTLWLARALSGDSLARSGY